MHLYLTDIGRMHLYLIKIVQTVGTLIVLGRNYESNFSGIYLQGVRYS
jgi:hypothetical protein